MLVLSTACKMNLTPDRCEASSIGQTGDLRAHDALCMNIAEYFRRGCSLEDDKKVVMTDLPPVYFQHQGMPAFLVSPSCS